MAWFSVTYTFSPSTTIKSSEHNQNFSDIVAGMNKAMPQGGIILWSGSIANIPAGWYLCDGNNGTPDLRDRFVVGAGNTYGVGGTGGQDSINLQHRHYDDHGHHMSFWSGNVNNDSSKSQGNYRVADNDHEHMVEGDTWGKNSGAYTDYQLSTTQDIRPPHYALAYIMKS